MSENNPLNCRIVLEDSAPFLKEIAKLRAENAELRKLVVDAWWSDRRFDSGSNNKRWEQWSAQHAILKEQPQEDIVQCSNCGAYLKEYDGEYCAKCSEDN